MLVWFLLSVLTSRFSLQSVSGVASSASFLAIAALGQMFVVASGGGNVDLSVGGVVTLSAFAIVVLGHGTDSGLWIAVPAVLLIGLAVGAFNAALVTVLRIPAIIATLATGYVLATATLLVNRAVAVYGVPPLMLQLGVAKTGGVPNIVLLMVAFAAAAMVLLGHTALGRQLLAVGQNRRAAYLSGVRTSGVVASAFLLSGVLAAIDGALLAAHSGGAFLGMGTPYLLQSIGAVVVGGTLTFGGSATILGTCFGSMLLVMLRNNPADHGSVRRLAGHGAGRGDYLRSGSGRQRGRPPWQVGRPTSRSDPSPRNAPGLM